MTAVDDWWETLSPFTVLGGAAGKVAADAWTSVMLSLWAAGLWLLRLVLGLVDAFLTPDLREGGPAAGVYRTTFWVAATLVLFMAMLQFGVAAFRRDGQSLARVAVGTAQFLMVWVAWISYAVLVLAACGGLTRAVMKATMGVDAWSQWQPWAAFSTKDIGDAAVATVLGVLGVILVFAAIGHLLVMLTRAGALVVLAATTPIAAAGLVSDAGRSWFWKSLRWFHAAAFTPVLMALVMGVGIQLTTGVIVGTADGVAKAVGTAVPGVLLILIGCFTPLALFRMLAFVDPGTSSGAAMRTGLAAQGGIQGLLSGGPATASDHRCGGVHRRQRAQRGGGRQRRRDHQPHHRGRHLPDAGSGPGRAGRRRRPGPGPEPQRPRRRGRGGPGQPDGSRAPRLRPRHRHHPTRRQRRWRAPGHPRRRRHHHRRPGRRHRRRWRGSERSWWARLHPGRRVRTSRVLPPARWRCARAGTGRRWWWSRRRRCRCRGRRGACRPGLTPSPLPLFPKELLSWPSSTPTTQGPGSGTSSACPGGRPPPSP